MPLNQSSMTLKRVVKEARGMPHKPIDDVSRPGVADVALATVRAAAGSVPIMGAAAAELIAFVVTPPLEARRNEWLNNLAQDLDVLQQRVDGFDVKALSSNDDFLSAVATGVTVATRSARREKRDLLRHAVLNAALGRVPEFDMQAVFIGYLEYVSPLHVQLLRALSDPRKALSEVGSRLEESMYMGAPAQIVEEVFPDLKGRRELYDSLWQDLFQRGLVNSDSLHGMMTKEGVLAARTTTLGDQFLSFLSRPPELTQATHTS
jgi:hypothetical protein